MAGTGLVLVVEHDAELRDRLGGWLEEAGFEVLVCPGPSQPDYTCVAGRGIPCPLTRAADLVVLDLWLGSDSVLQGTSSTELLSHYLESGKLVVAMAPRGDRDEFSKRLLDESVVLLDWPPERRELAETVRAVLTKAPNMRIQRGMVIRTVVPSPGVLSIDNSPPKDIARSRRFRSP
jgi:DNA-binding response OmpR family regulator